MFIDKEVVLKLQCLYIHMFTNKEAVLKARAQPSGFARLSFCFETVHLLHTVF